MAEGGRRRHNNTHLKVRFYIMSLWLLFVLIFFLTIDIPISFSPDAVFIGIIPLLKRNTLSFFSLIMAIIGWVFSRITNYEWSGVRNPPHTISKIKNVNYEYLTFLTTIIVPLICIDLSNIRYIIVLGILLVLIGSIFIKMDLYFGNPTLALLGYRLYRAEIDKVSAPDGIILICKGRLSCQAKIEWIKIDDYVWVAKECM